MNIADHLTDVLRAELATEHKRQSAMRTLIASLEGQLMHYRSKQAEADEAVRTLDSERAANAQLTAELAATKEALVDTKAAAFTAEMRLAAREREAERLRAELAACREAFQTYGDHTEDCAWYGHQRFETPADCTCGFNDCCYAVDAARKGEGE